MLNILDAIETTGENAYAMTVTAGGAAIKGTDSGTRRLTDLHCGGSLVLSAQGAGAPGPIAPAVTGQFGDSGNGTTQPTYDADAVLGCMIGGDDQWMLSSVSKPTAGELFGNKGVDIGADLVLVGVTTGALTDRRRH